MGRGSFWGKGFAGRRKGGDSRQQWQPTRQSERQQRGGDDSEKKTDITAISGAFIKSRSWLRSYPDKFGNCILDFGKGAKVFDADDLKMHLDFNNSEFKRRPHFTFSFASAALNSANTITQQLPEIETMPTTGFIGALYGFKKLIENEDGQALLKATSVLDMAQAQERNADDVKVAVITFLKYFHEQGSKMLPLLKRLASSSSKLFLGATWLVETNACTSDLEAWADGFPTDKSLNAMFNPSLRGWLRDPLQKQFLVQAIVRGYGQRMKAAGIEQEKVGWDDLQEEVEIKDAEESEEEVEVRPPKDTWEDDDMGTERASKGADGWDDQEPLVGKRARQQHSADWDAITESPPKASKGSGHASSSMAPAHAKTTAVPEKESLADAEKPSAEEQLVRSWGIEEFHAFLQQSQEKTSSASYQRMVVQDWKKFLEMIPSEIRQQHGLPMKTADFNIVLKNVEQTLQKIDDLVSKVIQAYMSKTEIYMNKLDIGIDGTLENHGLLRRLLNHSTYLVAVKEGLENLLQEHDNEKDVTKQRALAQQLDQAQQDTLKEYVMDRASSLMAWEKCVHFAEKHANTLPTCKDIHNFLALCNEDDLRDALLLQPLSKYKNKRLRPKGWNEDVKVWFTVAYLAYTTFQA